MSERTSLTRPNSMRKAKAQSPGVKVSTSGKTSVASTMTPAFGRKGARKMSRKGGR